MDRGTDSITSLDDQVTQLTQLGNAELGALVRNYLEGLLDTQLEGFTPDEQWVIVSVLRDMNLARIHYGREG